MFSFQVSNSTVILLLSGMLLYLTEGVRGLGEHGECDASQFKCKNDKCIPMAWRCDGDNDCGDDSDEEGCESKTCAPDDFRCTNDKCIPKRWQCDGDNDCYDGSDENPETCRAKECETDHVKCGNSSMCIPQPWVCDGQEDCPDGWDEKKCNPSTCMADEFTCTLSKKCITRRWLCDLDDDCGDNSDESNCTSTTCSAQQFTCNNTKCIPSRWRCDGDVDCTDGSDEHNCQTSQALSPCSDREFTCGNFDCIHISWKCDGDSDCIDGSDERNCGNDQVTCSPGHFKCQDGKRCIPNALKCNGVKDCDDNSDEYEVKCPAVVKPCDKTEFDCSGGRGEHCINNTKVCDNINHCGDFTDEGDFCKDKTDPCTDPSTCSQRCVRTYASNYYCDCFKGYILDKDNKTCIDIDECQVPGSCSHDCTNVKGGFKCSCQEGYEIDPARHHFCKAVGKEPSLLFSNRKDLRELRLETREFHPIVNATRSAVALDYDFQSRTVFWSDVAQEKIYSASLKSRGSPANVVASEVATPDGVAFDWIHQNLYWTDTGKDVIEVFHMKSKSRKVLISENLDEPRALVLNPLEGWMYWTDWGENATIQKCGMDGTDRRTIVQSNIAWPNGLTIDYVTKRLYWVDAKLHIIDSSDFDGQNRKVIMTSFIHLKHPFAITVFEDYLYWTDWEAESIQKVNKFNGKEREDIAVSLYSPMDIHVYHEVKQPNGTNLCGNNNGGCSHICLPSPQIDQYSPKYSCHCPTGVALSADRRNCESTPAVIPGGNKPTPQPTPVTKVIISTSKPDSTMKLNTHPPVIIPSITDSPEGNKNNTYIHTGPKDKIPELETANDMGKIAGIVIGIVTVVVVIVAIVIFVFYRQYNRRNTKTMNFDNPVYRKTTEDQLYLEKSQYQPSKTLPPSLEPLNQPTTELV